MITIDGSHNEGGGQILRTALTLSLATLTPFRIAKIRAGRKQPGLLRQHLAAVRAAVQISRAEVRGDAINSQELTFVPREMFREITDFQSVQQGALPLCYRPYCRF